MNAPASSGYCEHARPSLPGKSDGALSGLRFAVKDVLAVRGVRACYGNPRWLETHAPASQHATAVQQLLDAGASLSGLTLTDELALSLSGENAHYGTPLNPAAPERIPGGSSAGSATVVARGDVDFALGTDTGGSVRVPASHCGVLGLRPSHGAISTLGVLPLAPRFDTVGVLAASPELLERAAVALLPAQSAELPARLLALEPLLPLLDAEAGSAFRAAAGALSEALGAELVWHGLGRAPEPAEWLSSYLTLQNLEAATLHREWLESQQPRFGSLIARRIGWMLSTDASGREPAEACRSALELALADWLEGRAWLVLPSAPGAAPAKGLSDDQLEAYTGRALTLAALASLTGSPQLSLPCAQVEAAPFGVSLLAPPGSDRALLRAAKLVSHLLQPLPGAAS